MFGIIPPSFVRPRQGVGRRNSVGGEVRRRCSGSVGVPVCWRLPLLVSPLYDVVCRLLELLVLFGRRDRVEVNAGAPELLGEYDAQGVGYAKCIVMLVPLRRPERVDGWRTAEKGTGLARGRESRPSVSDSAPDDGRVLCRQRRTRRGRSITGVGEIISGP